MSERPSDMWGEQPGDLCRVLHPGKAWLHPTDCKSNGTNHINEGQVELDFDKPVLIIATTKNFQPVVGGNWTWCLLLTGDPRLCWLPSSLLRRIV